MTREERWEKLVSLIKDSHRRGQFDRLVEYLREHTSYFVAPASPAYHASWECGLWDHCMNVAQNAVILNRALKAGLNEEELVIAGLFHDLGKAFIAEDTPYYVFYEPTENQKKYGYVANKQFRYNDAGQVFMTVPQRSVRLITQFVDISDTAYQAILIHDGQYPGVFNDAYACKECPMALILHYADSWAGFTMEGKMVPSSTGKSYELLPPDDKVGYKGDWVRCSMTEDPSIVELANREAFKKY